MRQVGGGRWAGRERGVKPSRLTLTIKAGESVRQGESVGFDPGLRQTNVNLRQTNETGTFLSHFCHIGIAKEIGGEGGGGKCARARERENEIGGERGGDEGKEGGERERSGERGKGGRKNCEIRRGGDEVGPLKETRLHFFECICLPGARFHSKKWSLAPLFLRALDHSKEKKGKGEEAQEGN